MKLSRMRQPGRTCLRIVAFAALVVSAGCESEPPEGAWKYGCYNGPLANSEVVVTWSENGERAETTIGGRAYVFRKARSDLFNTVYKDGEATLWIDPELVFNPGGQGENSMCNPGSPVGETAG